MRQRLAIGSIAWILSLVAYAMTAAGLIAPQHLTALLSVVLIVYTAAEIWLYLRWRGGAPVSPVVVCSITVFLIPFGITNALFLLPENVQRRAGVYITEPQWLNKALILAFAACFAMWTGFESQLARRAGADIRRWLLAKGLLRKIATINWPTVVVCIVVSTAMRLYAISHGVFGYGSEGGQLIDLANQTQVIRLATQLGTAALLALGIAYYQSLSPQALVFVTALALNEVVWGLLSGFKSQVVAPLIALAICKWLVTRKSPKVLLGLSFVVLSLAYAVIEPLRVLRQRDINFGTRDLGALVDAVVSVIRDAREAGPRSSEATPTYMAIASRLNLTSLAGRAVEYEDNVGLGEYDPHFLTNIVMAPAYAVLPRAIWPEKPTSTTGQWFGATVAGTTPGTAVGMSPVAYLYFAGGATAVFLGFMFLGVAQRFVQEAFQLAHVGAAVAFVGMLGVVGTVDSEFHSVVIELIRYFPMMIVIQLMLFRRSHQAIRNPHGSRHWAIRRDDRMPPNGTGLSGVP